MSPNRVRAALVIAALAVGCAIAGAGIDHWVMQRGLRRGRGFGGPLQGNAPPEAASRRREEMLANMTEDLRLTPAQRSGIDSIMQRTDSALRVVRGEMQPRLKDIFERSRAEISTRLDPGQRVKFAQQQPPRRPRR
jgi:Spy/CpxP family protein refolding chaperone